MTLSGSSSYRSEDRRRREDDDDNDKSGSRDRSPHRSYDRHDTSSSSYQSQAGKQKLAFGFDKKASESESKKGGIQIKLGSGSSVSKIQLYLEFKL